MICFGGRTMRTTSLTSLVSSTSNTQLTTTLHFDLHLHLLLTVNQEIWRGGEYTIPDGWTLQAQARDAIFRMQARRGSYHLVDFMFVFYLSTRTQGKGKGQEWEPEADWTGKFLEPNHAIERGDTDIELIRQEIKKETAEIVMITQGAKKRDDEIKVAFPKAKAKSEAGKIPKKPNPEKKLSKKAQKKANGKKEEPKKAAAIVRPNQLSSAEERRQAKQLEIFQAGKKQAAMVQKEKKAAQQKQHELEAKVAALEQLKKELEDREHAAIQRSHDFYLLEHEATNNRLARKLASQKRKAEAREAKEARAAVKLQRRKERHQLRKDAKPDILKPVRAGVGKNKGHNKSKTRPKSTHAAPGNDQDEDDGEGKEEEGARAEAEITDGDEGENEAEAPEDEDVQEPSVARDVSSISEPPTKDSNIPEPGEDLSRIPSALHAAARAYLEERKSLAVRITETIEQLKALSARDVFIEARLSDMRISS
ncbi:hypothetical protein JHW43_005381 [Diplocarpon mali]|nr:hypothetical protein JHW43_005381 [Diplocarpon mali]